MAIKTFADVAAEDIFNSKNSKSARTLPQDAHKSIRKALNILNGAKSTLELGQHPGLQLTKRKDYPGFYSIWATLKIRVFFRFGEGADNNAYDVFVKNEHGQHTS